jgi:hypothetical protein
MSCDSCHCTSACVAFDILLFSVRVVEGVRIAASGSLLIRPRGPEMPQNGRHTGMRGRARSIKR